MIIPHFMFQAGPIRGQEGIFAGGQVIYIDDEINQIVDTQPIVQAPIDGDYHTQPLPEQEQPQPTLTVDAPVQSNPQEGA